MRWHLEVTLGETSSRTARPKACKEAMVLIDTGSKPCAGKWAYRPPQSPSSSSRESHEYLRNHQVGINMMRDIAQKQFSETKNRAEALSEGQIRSGYANSLTTSYPMGSLSVGSKLNKKIYMQLFHSWV